MLWTDKVTKILKKYWKIDNLKDKQFEVINELLLGNDVIGLLPTGYGKSMCYLIPPLVSNKIIFIISPLISLMEDQKDKLTKLGIPCSALHSLNKNKNEETFLIIDKKIKIVYMSPEYLIKGEGLELAKVLISEKKLGFLAIDESHCVSGWGHDFRPEYTKINIFRETYPDIPILAVTATATKIVCDDIIKSLSLNKPRIIRASFDRPNLFIDIRELPQVLAPKSKKKRKSEFVSVPKEDVIIPFLEKHKDDKIIIYINSRDDTEKLANNLNKIKNDCCLAYHAGLSKKEREDIQSKFTSGEIKIIISTIAFGLGIDQIVRIVMVFGSPSSIEEFYQQIGRGGRDGEKCYTVLYFDYSKLRISEYFISKTANPFIKKIKSDNLKRVSRLVYTKTCKRRYILEYFNEKCDFFTCDNCTTCKLEMIDLTDKIINLIKSKNITNELEDNIKRDLFISDHYNISINLKNWLDNINKIKIDNIPEKLKLKFPKNIVRIEEMKTEETFEEKINKYEKLLL